MSAAMATPGLPPAFLAGMQNTSPNAQPQPAPTAEQMEAMQEIFNSFAQAEGHDMSTMSEEDREKAIHSYNRTRLQAAQQQQQQQEGGQNKSQSSTFATDTATTDGYSSTGTLGTGTETERGSLSGGKSHGI